MMMAFSPKRLASFSDPEACAKIFAKFVLLHDQVVRLIRIPDHILRFVIGGRGKRYDLVTTGPDVRRTFVGIRDGLSYIEMVWSSGEYCALLIAANCNRRRMLLDGAPI
jgi:hypothetical protein